MHVTALRGALFAPDRQQRKASSTRPRSPELPAGPEVAQPGRNRTLTIATLADERGQAFVEFALVLPILVTFLFLIFELAIVLTHSLTLNDAASVAARAAAVYRFNGEPNACQAAKDAAPGAAGSLPVSVSCAGTNTPGSTFKVTVTTPWSISLPLLPLSTGGQLSSSATEKLE
jgi:Flp pilus assembly protein TadG